jgi:hypothetical protein
LSGFLSLSEAASLLRKGGEAGVGYPKIKINTPPAVAGTPLKEENTTVAAKLPPSQKNNQISVYFTIILSKFV